MIEPIRAKLNAGFQSDQNEVDTTWLNRFRTNLQQAKVEVVAELGRTEINVREFLNLKVGDVIQLEQEVDKPLAVTVEGITKFKGFQGSYKGHQALKVTELVYKPPVVDEILLQ
jgi:flagellar motor switch protein FliM